MEFILFVCSSFGIWFGFSIISLNPFDRKIIICKQNKPSHITKRLEHRHQKQVLHDR
jgi:hypothetical protein